MQQAASPAIGSGQRLTAAGSTGAGQQLVQLQQPPRLLAVPASPSLSPDPASALDAAIFAHGRKRRRVYRDIETIGQGSEARVKLVESRETGQRLALKIMPKPTAGEAGGSGTMGMGMGVGVTSGSRGDSAADQAGPLPSEKRRTEAEMRRRFAAVQPLSHTHANMPRYVELMESDSKFYFVMEHCAGGDLAEYVAHHGGRLPECQAATVVSTLVDVLAFLHANGVVHRDVKPSNVLLRDQNRLDTLCLADYASCHVELSETTANPSTLTTTTTEELHSVSNCSPTQSEDSLSDGDEMNGRRRSSTDNVPGQTPMKTLTGTPFFLPPEIVVGSTYDSKVDIWALGCLAYYLLFGRTPFQDSVSFVELYSRISSGKFEIPEDGGVSEEATMFLRRTLSTDPESRPSAVEAKSEPWLVRWSSERGSRRKERVTSGASVFFDQGTGELMWVRAGEGVLA